MVGVAPRLRSRCLSRCPGARHPGAFGFPGKILLALLDLLALPCYCSGMTNTIDRYTFEDALAVEGVISESIGSDYTGRGMFGATCVSVTVSPSEVSRVPLALSRYAEGLREEADECEDPEYDLDPEMLSEQRDLADLLDRMAESVSSDSMGLDMVVYFPGWEFS